MSYQYIETTEQEKTFLITVNRPSSLNALNRTTIQEIGTAVESVRNNPKIAGVVITGAGNKAFVAGADISEFSDYAPEQGSEMSSDGHKVFNAIEDFSKPVIAAINGFALGGGCELAMACHIRLATPGSKFGQPEVNLGIIPGYGGTQRLAALVGKGKALELLITGDLIDTAEAHRIGLVNHIVEQDKLMDHALRLIDKISKKGPLAVARCIKLLNSAYRTESSVGAGYVLESESFGELMGSDDFKEGTAAFLEKRKPEFTGK